MENPPAAAVPFKHKLILEELNGGTDSAVSPDGKWLAFSTRRSGNLDVWIANVETGQTRQITSNPATDNEARWSPDGKKLCFVSQRNGSQDIYVVDLDTGKETPIATQPYSEDYPSFSQDGSEIVFTGGPRGFREVQVYSFATGKIRTVTRGFGYIGSANFSPDSKHIVFHAYYDNNYNSGKSDVFVVPAQGGEAVNITKEGTVWNYKPCWSWDGNWITYSSKRATPNFNLWVIRPDGSERRALTNVEGPDLRWSNWTKDHRLGWHQVNPQTGRIRAVELATGQVTDLHTSDFHMRDLSASPDGKHLLYETDFQIHVLEAVPGAEPRAIVSGVAPRWSRDGRTISYLVERRSRIGVVSLEGGDERILDVKPAAWPEASTSGWSPDGLTIAVVTAEGEHNLLTVVGRDGAQRTLVDNTELKSSPVWSPDGKVIFFAENHPATVGYYISMEPVIRTEQAGSAILRSSLPLALDQPCAEPIEAPDFALRNIDGDLVRLSDIGAPVTLLYFWSTSRECESDLRALDKLRERYADRGAAILGLSYSSGTPDEVGRFLNSVGAELPTLMCTRRVCDDYGVAIFPTAFVLDRDHRIRYWKYGVQIEEHWEQLLSDMLRTE
ncbi:MAG: PD40 domain-containing protein [Planctomycetes bacterium]|nr:PD40 domain-containing protein [Planctomycetota bacterium]